MRLYAPPFLVLALAACAGAGPPAVAPLAFALPDSIQVLDASTGNPVGAPELLSRAAAADFLLLGEVHDNPTHHAWRGVLLQALAGRRPAIVFEQLARSRGPLPRPDAVERLESWLDRHGFDRTGWRWPLHRPVVEAGLAHGREVRGSGLSRDALRSVVRAGDSALAEPLRALIARAPLDAGAQARMDRALVEGHCGQLPASMLGGMRSAQVARDAAMTLALVEAGAPAVLIAGNGHVQHGLAVPRLLSTAAPGQRVLVVGSLERGADGSLPGLEARAGYDLVVLTPRTARPDPCAGFRAPR